MEAKRIFVFLALLHFFTSLDAKKVPTWCAQGIDAYRKCLDITTRYPEKMECVLGLGEQDCYEKINNGEADLSAFDGGSIYDAGKKYGLQVIMSERLKSLASAGTKYFAVAVVKASSKLTFSTLKGAKSCHTGVQKSSGWILPLGILLNANLMPCVKGDQYASVADYFSSSCAPGAAMPKYNKKLFGVSKLCELCSGIGNSKCARNENEPFYGYLGAFKCLEKGVGDVAFIKQSILTDMSPADQAKYKLLCPDNTFAAPKDFYKCHLAGSPAHAVLTRSDASIDKIAEYQSLLEQAAKAFNPYSRINIFDGKIFSKGAIGLDKVPMKRRSFIKYLGEGYVNAISALEGCA